MNQHICNFKNLVKESLEIGQQLVDAFLRGAPWIVFAAKLVPLLIFLPGMLRDRLRSYVWLCFVSLLYLVILVERVFAGGAAN